MTKEMYCFGHIAFQVYSSAVGKHNPTIILISKNVILIDARKNNGK